MFTDPSILQSILLLQPSATVLKLADTAAKSIELLEVADPPNKNVLAVGPGLGQDPDRQHLVEALLATKRRMVLDADGLNNLVGLESDWMAKRAGVDLVLTPHPGEFRRLDSMF